MHCPACDAPVPAQAPRCAECGDKLSRRQGRRRLEEEDEEGAERVVPHKNLTAIRSYHVGVIGLIPGLGLVLGPVALALGVFGVRYGKANRAARESGHAAVGILLGALELLFNGAGLILMLIGLRGA
jgi:hypothetical protein